MNSFFRKLPLPFKLMLIGLVPLIFITYLSFNLYIEKEQKLGILENFIERMDQSADLTRLIDNLQQEREYSFEYILKGNQGKEMLSQRPKVDSIILRVESTKDSSLKGFTSYAFLKNLALTRKAIDSGKTDANGVMHFYSSSIFRLNTLNTVVPPNDVYLRTIYRDMTAQKLLSEMITYLGLINANVYNLLYTKQYVVETLMGTYPSYEVMNSYEVEFLQKAPPGVIQSYKQIRNTTLKPTMDYLEKLFKTFHSDSTYNSRQWSELSSKGLNDLRNLQMNLLHNVEKNTSEIYTKEKRSKTQTIVFLIIALVLVTGIVAYAIYMINSMLHDIKLAALKISRGETGIELKNIPQDVMGSVAQSIYKIDGNYKILAEAAGAIGEGNFNVALHPRSKDDVLVNALLQMKDNLQRSAEETEASREQFRQLADFVPQIVWTAAPNGFPDYYNKQWYEYTGLKEGHDEQSWMRILHPDDLQYCIRSWYESVKTGRPYEVEYRFRDRKNGGYRWFLGRAVPVRNADGDIVKWFGTCTDIHEGKSMTENLETLVKERTEQLERSNDDLQQFAHVASHDLKEPLRKIGVFSTRLKEEFHHAIPDKGRSYVEKIQLAAQRMSAMIEGVLNYSLVSNNEQDFETVDLNEIMNEITIDLELVIQQKAAVINYEKLPTVKGIRLLIYQLFYNLVNNALKFSKDTEKNIITVTATKVDGAEINEHPNILPGQKYIVTAISDRGIGFDSDQSERVFQIFTRLNNKDKYEGTGLGLALCKKIVLRHKGAIWASGEKDHGATITVALPA